MIDFERLLETYTLAEILELNNCTEAEAVEYLYEEQFLLELPPIPVDAND